MRIKQYSCGETEVVYLITEEGRTSLLLLPHRTADRLVKAWEREKEASSARSEYRREWQCGSLVQLHLRHHNRSCGNGVTMKFSQSTDLLRFADQRTEENEEEVRIVTSLISPENYGVLHILTWKKGKRAFFCETEFLNKSDREMELEMLSSFCLENLSPFQDGDQTDLLNLHRFRGGWALEGLHVCDSVEELGMQKAWCAPFPKGEKFGSVGSWPTQKFFPLAALEDRENHVFWSAALECNTSWMMELTRNGDTFSFSGGLADVEFGAWMKRVKPGESFRAPRAYIGVAEGDIFESCQILTQLEEIAASAFGEEGLPVVFNEYCSSWGNPTQENILRYAGVLRDKGIRYLVIDAGWSLGSREQWGNGEWQVDPARFPDMKGMNRKLREMGFIPGIWFEFEVTTEGSGVYEREYDEMHLKREGILLRTGPIRTFWDFRNPQVVEYLSERVIGMLKEYGFGYLKVDYNGNIGLGCDGAESLGEGLRQHLEGVTEFFRKIKKEIPDIVIENCASGGNRTEPSMLGCSAMTSFSDAHEAREIPRIAANLQNLVLPRQNQIWAVLRADDSLEWLEYRIAAGFPGRICLSGDVDRLSEEQWEVIRKGLAFYGKLENVLKNGLTRVYGRQESRIRHPRGTQVILRKNERELLLVCHAFQDTDEEMVIPMEKGFEVEALFGRRAFRFEEGRIIVPKMKEWTAAAAYLVRRM